MTINQKIIFKQIRPSHSTWLNDWYTPHPNRGRSQWFDVTRTTKRIVFRIQRTPLHLRNANPRAENIGESTLHRKPQRASEKPNKSLPRMSTATCYHIITNVEFNVCGFGPFWAPTFRTRYRTVSRRGPTVVVSQKA